MRRPTTAERIIWLFEDRVTEAHRRAIEKSLEITAEEFDCAIPKARDLGVTKGLRLTPIYERDGWWTAEPTRRLAAIALHEAVKRHLGEAKRNARVYAEFGELDAFTKYHDAAAQGTLTAFVANLRELEIAPESDYVLTRVDDANPNLYVLREAVA